MPDLFGNEYEIAPSPGSSSWGPGDVPNWGTNWTMGSGQNQSTVSPGDVINVIGWGAGLVTQIVGLIANAKHQETEEEIAVIIPPPPPVVEETDYTPIIIGSVGVLLVLVLAMKK